MRAAHVQLRRGAAGPGRGVAYGGVGGRGVRANVAHDLVAPAGMGRQDIALDPPDDYIAIPRSTVVLGVR